jgi:sortase A
MRTMRIPGRTADILILTGLALIFVGSAMAYPFVRDTLHAQSDPTSLSFAITLEPDQIEATPVGTTDAATVRPIVTDPATATALPLPLTAAVVASTATRVPAPLILPDDSTAGASLAPAGTPLPATPIAIGDPPTRLVIGVIGLDAPVVTVGWHTEQSGSSLISVWDVPDWQAAGWLKTSAPAGQKGNTVLDGHHNINGQVFRRLVDLKPKDEIELYAGARVLHYVVTQKLILPDRDQPMQVRIENAKWIQPTDDERLTLVTCWPYTNNTHRLIIVARPLKSNGGNSPE